MITPNSKFIILKSPIELDNLNQLTFANASSQYNYFYNLSKREYDEVSFVRKDNIVVVETDEDFTYDDLLLYNYCMYQNTSYDDKWFYAFIEDCNYLSDGSCELKIKTDVFQTWQFDITWKQSFIEREHIAKSNDVIGANLVPENVETGEYISTNLQPTNNDLGDTCYVVSTTEKWLTNYTIQNQSLPTGTYYTGFDNLDGVYDYIKMIDNNAGSDSINSIFVAPKGFFSNWSIVQDITGNVSTSVNYEYNPSNIEITHVDYLGNNYQPLNKKLLTFPFSFLQVSNHSGTIVNYRWEDFNLLSQFSEGKYAFKIGCVLTPSCSCYLYPLNYKNILNNYDEGITFGKFPIGGWNSDTYTNWLTQNGVNIGLSIGASALTTMAGISSKTPSTTASGIIGIAQAIGSIYEHSLIPNQARGNVNVGDFNFTNNWLSIEFKRISIKNEFAKIIDDYFTMYGYATNELKLPNLNNRSNWNFVKTINANILGDIPQKDLEEIKSMFNNGLTLWHTTTHFLDYSQSNN